MELSHVNDKGEARMVDVSQKQMTQRVATASARVRMAKETMALIAKGQMPKGDVLATARIAGIMGAKQTDKLIPMCHNLPLDGITVDLEMDQEEGVVRILATATCVWKTGVEMEALTGATVAALTLYDMCKAVDKGMVIEAVQLEKKTGGKSGVYIREK
jgi:cyclic pyranopterin phosphate synthase